MTHEMISMELANVVKIAAINIRIPTNLSVGAVKMENYHMV